MAQYRHLKNAPINEALIDLRVKLPEDKRKVDLLEKMHDQIKDRFPEKKQQIEHRLEFHSGPPTTEKKTTDHVGYRFASEDGLWVVQATINGFTLSRLKPYETWENLRDEAKQIWRIYEDILSPEAVTRVATRFINKIEIPGPNIDFDDYLTAAPVIPKALSQIMMGFFSRVVVPDEKSKSVGIITQNFEPGINPQVIPILLDIDVFKEKLFEIQDPIWDTIDCLREVKNRIFFDSITEKTAGLFE